MIVERKIYVELFGEEVNDFKFLIDILTEQSARPGYCNPFSTDQIDLIKNLRDKLK